MKLALTLGSSIALSVGALPHFPSGSGGLCPPGGCVIEPTTSSVAAPTQVPSDSGGLCPPGHGCVIDPTALRLTANMLVPTTLKTTPSSIHREGEKRQAGWPTCTIIHGFIRCTTSSVRSSTRDILPTSSSPPGGIPTTPPPPPHNERDPTYILSTPSRVASMTPGCSVFDRGPRSTTARSSATCEAVRRVC
ncbi:hypothetical protein PMIN06_012181 [Paraphaeosphaeria minitans]